MLQLNKSLLIGQGRDRACYAHPLQDDLCIKVAIRPEKQTRRERIYFRLLQKRQVDLSRVALFRGTVLTNLGHGALFDRIRNEDGTPALTLTDTIRQQQVSPELLVEEVEALRHYLETQVICVRDLSPNNIMVSLDATAEPRLIIVDGVSNPGVNPLNIRWKLLSRYFIQRSWRSFSEKLTRLKNEQSVTQL